MISQIDYLLIDFRGSAASFYALETYLIGLQPKSDKELVTYQSIESELASSSANRKTVESLVGQRISGLEWTSLSMLYLLISFFLLDLNTARKILPALLTSGLLTAVFLLLMLLREIDVLHWQEGSWIWQPLNDLFISLGLVPYYPLPVLSKKRISLKEGSEIRVAYYGDAYPDFTHKKVVTMTVSKDFYSELEQNRPKRS